MNAIIKEGDIVQIRRDKYPELAWVYCEVKKVKSKNAIHQEYILNLPSPGKKRPKKVKKEFKRAKKILKKISFNSSDLVLILQNPRNKETYG